MHMHMHTHVHAAHRFIRHYFVEGRAGEGTQVKSCPPTDANGLSLAAAAPPPPQPPPPAPAAAAAAAEVPSTLSSITAPQTLAPPQTLQPPHTHSAVRRPSPVQPIAHQPAHTHTADSRPTPATPPHTHQTTCTLPEGKDNGMSLPPQHSIPAPPPNVCSAVGGSHGKLTGIYLYPIKSCAPQQVCKCVFLCVYTSVCVCV
jgi:hypothetical protein